MGPSCFICLGLAAIASARSLGVTVSDRFHEGPTSHVPRTPRAGGGSRHGVNMHGVLEDALQPGTSFRPSDRALCTWSADSQAYECATIDDLVTALYAESAGGPPGRNCTSHGDHAHCMGKDGLKETCFLEEDGVWVCHGEGPGSPCVVHGGHTHGDCSGQCENIDLGHYDVNLHVLSLFVVLIASCLGAVLPILASKQLSRPFVRWTTFVCKHFGTGIILSTAFVHLLYHAFVMFANPCLGDLGFEPTASAIALTGVLIVFFADYAMMRFIQSRAVEARPIVQHEEAAVGTSSLASGAGSSGYGTFSRDSSPSPSKVSNPPSESTALARSSYAFVDVSRNESGIDYVWPQAHFDVYLLEAGIIFHSIMIGVSLGATGGEQWMPLFIAIIFHQFFEGLALGTRISALAWRPHQWWRKWAMASAFGIITPLGIAIGISLHASYNPNSTTALLTTGVLDALSAGVLMYAGIVELLVHDFMHGELAHARSVNVAAAASALLAGTIAMSVLGKWV
ncbi:Zip-domain-containing protein [Auricularia subglabra TFB-10046 SS5]|nr:Zip-domain-containing protein [Auricularia subglabra TFB-10046 SS5]